MLFCQIQQIKHLTNVTIRRSCLLTVHISMEHIKGADTAGINDATNSLPVTLYILFAVILPNPDFLHILLYSCSSSVHRSCMYSSLCDAEGRFVQRATEIMNFCLCKSWVEVLTRTDTATWSEATDGEFFTLLCLSEVKQLLGWSIAPASREEDAFRSPVFTINH